MKENSAVERLYNGVVKENPTFVLMLGMCPTLAVTTSAINGLGMGLTTAVVLALSNMIISLLRKVIPDKVRIPAFIVIIASFVTIVQLLLEAYLPSLNEALGVYIPLIVVNCIILGRAEAYAYFNGPVASLFDGIGMGLGFSVALTCIGAVRELLGTGKLFDVAVMPESFTPIGIFVLAPGAFFVLAVLCAIQNFVKIRGEKKGKDMSKIGSGCSHDCMNCLESGCADRTAKKTEDKDVKPEVKAEEQEEVKAEVEVKEEVKEKKKKSKAKAVSETSVEDNAEITAEEKSEEKSEEKPEEKSEEKPETKKKEKAKSKAKKKPDKKEEIIEDQDLEMIDLDKEED